MSNSQISTQKHTKSHQVTNLMDTFGMSRTQATKVLDVVIRDIEDALHNGKAVQMSGVGTLYVKDVASRQRINPSTRELFTMPAHRRIAFRQSKAGQKRLNGN